MANETLTDVFSDIADAIRAKGLTGQMKPTEMSTKIADIPSGGGGDPRYEVDANGQLVKKEFDITWFNDLTVLNINMGHAYSSGGVRTINFPNLSSSVNPGKFTFTFESCTELSSASFPNLTTAYGETFNNTFPNCTNLVELSLPNLVDMSNGYFGGDAFDMMCRGCTSLKRVYLTKYSDTAKTIGRAFWDCSSLELIDFHLATAVPKVASNTFNNSNTTFQIVVPDELYDTWITATNWSARASQIVKYSEYTSAN